MSANTALSGEDRAYRYVEQLEAHMDEGGGTGPNNVRDLIQMVRQLVGRCAVLSDDLYRARQEISYTCSQCSQPIPHAGLMYRCADCSQPFHQDCIKAHFASVPPLKAP